jgi:predicted ATPase
MLTLATPHLEPSNSPERKIKRFCRMMGIGPMGIARYAPAAVSAARSEAYTIM